MLARRERRTHSPYQAPHPQKKPLTCATRSCRDTSRSGSSNPRRGRRLPRPAVVATSWQQGQAVTHASPILRCSRQVGRVLPADLSDCSAEGVGSVKAGPLGPAAGGPGGATLTGSAPGATGKAGCGGRRRRGCAKHDATGSPRSGTLVIRPGRGWGCGVLLVVVALAWRRGGFCVAGRCAALSVGGCVR